MIRRSRTASFALTILAATSFTPVMAYERAQIGARAESVRQITFDIYLPTPNRAERDRLLDALVNPVSPLYHHWLTPTEFQNRFGLDPSTVARVTAELAANGLTVTGVHTHSLTVTGSAGAIEAAFATRLHHAQFGAGRTRFAAERPLSLTPQLVAAGAITPAFETKIRMSRHSKVGPLHRPAAATVRPDNRYGALGSYWFDDLKQAYEYPSYLAVNGANSLGHIYGGVLMSNSFNQYDMDLYFNNEGLNSPSITDIPIDGGAPYDINGSAETHLDLQQMGGMAPQSALLLYDLAALDDGTIYNGLRAILQDNLANVVNMSFGAPEVLYTAAYNAGVDQTAMLGIYNDYFAQGNAQGITFVASSGDYGSEPAPAAACFENNAGPGCGGFVRSVEIPASSPNVTAVGGTTELATYQASNSTGSAYHFEQSYGDRVSSVPETGTYASNGEWASGGGISIYFPRPSYQTLVNTGSRYRTVPDLAGHMGGLYGIGCPSNAVQPCNPNRSSDVLVIGGQETAVIGTSASSPDIAGMILLRDTISTHRWGNINTVLYTAAHQQALHQIHNAFHQGMPGENGLYRAGAAYNYVTGNGTPVGIDFMDRAPPAPAGNPGTPGNP